MKMRETEWNREWRMENGAIRGEWVILGMTSDGED